MQTAFLGSSLHCSHAQEQKKLTGIVKCYVIVTDGDVFMSKHVHMGVRINYKATVFLRHYLEGSGDLEERRCPSLQY